jgi:hypothetical protein
MSKNKDFPRSEVSELKQLISSLKQKIKQKDDKISRLISEIKTLNKAFSDSIVYINEDLIDVPVEEIIKFFNTKRKPKLTEVKKEHQESLASLKEKWQCFRCKSGYLKLIVIERQDGKKYLRACSNSRCRNKTELKNWTPDVTGVIEKEII